VERIDLRPNLGTSRQRGYGWSPVAPAINRAESHNLSHRSSLDELSVRLRARVRRAMTPLPDVPPEHAGSNADGNANGDALGTRQHQGALGPTATCQCGNGKVVETGGAEQCGVLQALLAAMPRPARRRNRRAGLAAGLALVRSLVNGQKAATRLTLVKVSVFSKPGGTKLLYWTV
jgi:hypothetical protein